MNHILYHANCADGFSAYWVTQKALTLQGKEWVAHPGDYALRFKAKELNPGDTLYIVDFSLPVETIQELLANHVNVIWLDHHIGTYEMYMKAGLLEAPELPDDDFLEETGLITEYSYTVQKSGATICWEYFQGIFDRHNIERPKLLNYVEDRDLWRFKLAHSKEVTAAVFSYEYTLENWDALMSLDAAKWVQMIAQGEALSRKHFKDIKELLAANAHLVSIEGRKYWACNLPYTMASDAASILAQMPLPDGSRPKAALCYTIKGALMQVSFRSLSDGPDVAALARKFLGNGHTHAAGANFPVSQFNLATLELIPC